MEILYGFVSSMMVSIAIMTVMWLRHNYRSWNPRHWVGPGAISIETTMTTNWDADATYEQQKSSIMWKWLRENCKGRWRIGYHVVYFSSKQDATLFLLFADQLIEGYTNE